MYKRILVPLDGSRRAETVLRYVEELAHRCEAGVILVRVVEWAGPIGAAESAYGGLRRRELEQATQEARDYLMPVQGTLRAKGIDARMAVAYGRPVDAILQTAAESDVDLIVIASHGRGGLSRVFHGSVAAGLLQRTSRPLLLIPSRDA